VHDDTIKEEFLFCESLLETTKAANVLEMVKILFLQRREKKLLTGKKSFTLFAQLELLRFLVIYLVLLP
jgi:hypothetical protein